MKPHLHAGNDAAEIADQLLDDFRARVALFDKLAHAGQADGDEREFGGGEKRVHADQEQHAEDVERRHAAAGPSLRKIVGRGSSLDAKIAKTRICANSIRA